MNIFPIVFCIMLNAYVCISWIMGYTFYKVMKYTQCRHRIYIHRIQSKVYCCSISQKKYVVVCCVLKNSQYNTNVQCIFLSLFLFSLYIFFLHKYKWGLSNMIWYEIWMKRNSSTNKRREKNGWSINIRVVDETGNANSYYPLFTTLHCYVVNTLQLTVCISESYISSIGLKELLSSPYLILNYFIT